MSEALNKLWDLLTKALSLELATTEGRLDLFLSVVAAGMIALFLAGKAIERIGNFVLRALKRQGTRAGARDNFYAIVSLLVFFFFSLVVVTVAQHFLS